MAGGEKPTSWKRRRHKGSKAAKLIAFHCLLLPIAHAATSVHQQCDLLNMPAVAQLEKDDKYGLVYELLRIFLSQRLDTYLEFQTANSTLLKDYGLIHDECVTKMRLMSLVDLSSRCSSEIPYSAIIDALKINDDEVEYWIMKAVALKILDCKIDQLNQTVSRHTERIFGCHSGRVCAQSLEFGGVTLVSNRIEQWQLRPADHIYCWRKRAAYTYSHHGIYENDKKVIQYCSASLWSSSSPVRPCPECAAAERKGGIVISCLDCFLEEDSIRLFAYSLL